MKRILIALTLLLPLSALAQSHDATLRREGDRMAVSADISLTPAMVKGVKAFVLVPQVTDGEHCVALRPIGLYSKDKFYSYLEPYGFKGAPDEQVFRREQLPTTVHLATSVPYEVWMDGAQLQLVHKYEGCCGDSGVEAVDSLTRYDEAPIAFAPAFREVEKDRTMKLESLSGEAAIEFMVGKTTLDEKYRNNAAELAKIKESIDAVRSNKEVYLRTVRIKGHASPDGKYATNEKLSQGRTQAVRDYVASQYDFPEHVIVAEAEAENWAGLRKFVEGSSLKNKQAILDIIDSDLAPDTKEQRIRSKYPAQWNTLKKECLPLLRRTEYAIEFLTVDYEAVATKVEMANNAMKEGDWDKASEILSTAGDEAEAAYARGTLAAMKEDFATAAAEFKKALDGGIAEAKAKWEEVSRHRFINKEKVVSTEPTE